MTPEQSAVADQANAMSAEVAARTAMHEQAASFIDSAAFETVKSEIACREAERVIVALGGDPRIGDLFDRELVLAPRDGMTNPQWYSYRRVCVRAAEMWMRRHGLAPAMVPEYPLLVAALYPVAARAPRRRTQADPALVTAFEAHLVAGDVDPAPALRVVRQWWGWCVAHDVTDPIQLAPRHLITWRQELRDRMGRGEIIDRTASHKVTAIRRLLRFAELRGFVAPDLAKWLKPLPVQPRYQRRALSVEQFAALLAQAAQEKRDAVLKCALVVAAAASGARLCELLAMRGEHARRDDGGEWSISIWCRKGRRKERRNLRLSPAAGVWLDLYARTVPPKPGEPFFRTAGGKPMTADALGSCFRAWIRAAGIPPEVKGWHCLRHTTLTALDRSGVSISTLQAISGQSEFGGALPHYIHHADAELASAVEGALGHLGGAVQP